ncbi:MAG: chemotaxis protein CheC [Oscillospiraceae bacterium]|nr:chemotaxis protein CheC [Oscillospiraceae bacterium]
MGIRNVEELQDMHLDVLKEIGNIGSGNAASALSTMLNCETDISVPNVKLLDFSDAVNFLGGPENIAIGMLVNLTEDINGMMLYVLQHSCASQMTSAIFGSEIEDLANMNEMERSFIAEVGNIMSASYINAIASLTGLTIDISVPQMCVDMVGAILSVPAVQFAQVGNKVLFIDDSFVIGGCEVKSNMILVPEMSSLEFLFNRLGVGI